MWFRTQANHCSWPLSTTHSRPTASFPQALPRKMSAVLSPVSTTNLIQPINFQAWRRSRVKRRRRVNQTGWAFLRLSSSKEPQEYDPDTFSKCWLWAHLHSFLWCYIPLMYIFCLRRSCSIDKCPLSPGALALSSQRRDMVRSESLRADPGERTHRIFRPSDLIHGEVLGKGFFGQAVKVTQLGFPSFS